MGLLFFFIICLIIPNCTLYKVSNPAASFTYIYPPPWPRGSIHHFWSVTSLNHSIIAPTCCPCGCNNHGSFYLSAVNGYLGYTCYWMRTEHETTFVQSFCICLLFAVSGTLAVFLLGYFPTRVLILIPENNANKHILTL